MGDAGIEQVICFSFELLQHSIKILQQLWHSIQVIFTTSSNHILKLLILKNNIIIFWIFSKGNKLRNTGKQINKFFHSNDENLSLLENECLVECEMFEFRISQKWFLLNRIKMIFKKIYYKRNENIPWCFRIDLDKI